MKFMFVLVLIALATPAYAVTVSGHVTLEGGGALAGATVRIGEWSAVTEGDGAYTIDGPAAGAYDARVSAHDCYNRRRTVVLVEGSNTFDETLVASS